MEDVEEISKKDLLRETGISYGQFYRWKRMGLIPEAWFRRRSTFTGQESFLPRRQVLERIARIQELKDGLSLDEIGEMLSPNAVRRSCTVAEARRMPAFKRAVELLSGTADAGVLRHLDLLALTLAEHLLSEGLAKDRVRLACGVLLERFDDLPDGGAGATLIVGARDGSAFAAMCTGKCVFDAGTAVLASVDMSKLVEDLNVALRNAEVA